MNKKILIVTSSNEKNVDKVISYLNEKDYFRFDVDCFSEYKVMHSHSSNSEWKISIGNKVVRNKGVKSIWYRRPEFPKFSEKISQQSIDFSRSETKLFLKGLWSGFRKESVLWVNDPYVLYEIECNKLFQLKIAKKSDMKIPKTLVTNDFREARIFLDKIGKVAIKAFGGAGLQDKEGKYSAVYTTIINKDQLSRYSEGIKYAPVLFQEYIPKHLELRITVVGSKIFTCAIHSQDSERTKHDWRKYDFDNVKHEIFQLPKEVEDKVFRFMKKLNLQFGAIDMILTPKGDYVFLEVNPSGQWGWIEALTGMPIYKSLAELLINPELAL